MLTGNKCCDILSLGTGAIVWSLIDLVWGGLVIFYVIYSKETYYRGLSIFWDHLISEASVVDQSLSNVLIHLPLDYFIYYKLSKARSILDS